MVAAKGKGKIRKYMKKAAGGSSPSAASNVSYLITTLG